MHQLCVYHQPLSRVIFGIPERFVANDSRPLLPEIFNGKLRSRCGVLDRHIPIGDKFTDAVAIVRTGDMANTNIIIQKLARTQKPIALGLSETKQTNFFLSGLHF